MINNIKNKVAPYEHEGRWFKAFIEKDENGGLKLTRCDLPGAELTEDGLKLPEGFHAVYYTFDTHYTAPALLTGQEHATIPTATPSTIGGVKIGEGLSINSDGELSVQQDSRIYDYGSISSSVSKALKLDSNIYTKSATAGTSNVTGEGYLKMTYGAGTNLHSINHTSLIPVVKVNDELTISYTDAVIYYNELFVYVFNGKPNSFNVTSFRIPIYTTQEA